MRQACTPARGVSWVAEREVAEFCMGGVSGCVCLRGLPGQRRIPLATTMGLGDAMHSVAGGAGRGEFWSGTTVAGCILARQSSHYHDARNLMLIRDAANGDVFAPTIRQNNMRHGRGGGSIFSTGLRSTR